MAEQITIKLISRPGVGSNAVKKLRAQGLAPANIFGHGEPVTVATDAHEFRQSVSTEHYGSQLVHLELDGKDAGMAMVKAVQVNTLKRQILNIDFQRVNIEDRVTVQVPVVAVGTPVDTRIGGMLDQAVHNIALRCDAFSVPEQITVDVTNMHIGDAVHGSDLPLPPGVELAATPDELILHVVAPTKSAQESGAGETEVSEPSLAGGKQKNQAEGEA